MVLTRFSWPYGGRHVAICGSFMRWAEQYQMVLVEGSMGEYQAIFDLPPGVYQILQGPLDFESEPWPGISDSAKDLIRNMLNRDPKKRYTAHDVLCDPWIVDDTVAPDRPLDSAVLSRLKQFSAMNKLKKMALRAHPWFKGTEWDRLYQMEAAFIPEVNDELDTQNFEKFEESADQTQTSSKSGPWRKAENYSEVVDINCVVQLDGDDNQLVTESCKKDYSWWEEAVKFADCMEKEDASGMCNLLS